MNELELKAAMLEAEQKRDAMKAELKTAIDAQKAELTAKIEEIENLRKSMQKQLDEIATEQKKDKHVPSEKAMSFAQELKAELTKRIEEIKALGSGKGHSVTLELKTFLESANASITTGSLIPTPQIEVGINKAPDRMPFMQDIIASGVANSNVIHWVQRKTRTNNGGFVTEGTVTKVGGGSVAQSVLGWETKNATMQNILSFIKVSNNSIDDIDWLISEVQTELTTLMALDLDDALLNGTAGVNGFDGVLTLATAFNAGGKTLKPGVLPNNFDAIKFAATQVKKAHFKPNIVVMHPDDILALELERDGDGQYLFPPYMNLQVNPAGLRVVENTGIPTGSYLVGDFTKAKFWMRKGMELKIHDQNEDDAINQLKTVTLYMRGVLVVKDADKLAFVTDTFAGSIAEITLAGA
jgi:HK97 family phage major capsid protein